MFNIFFNNQMIKLFIFLSSLLFLQIITFSQEKTVVITGIIKNKNGNVIENAQIFGKISGKGTISNNKGYFKLNIQTNDTTLIISHISYKKQWEQIAERIKNEDSLHLEIILEIKPHYLPSIDVVDDKQWMLDKTNKIWIYDYELIGNDQIITLIKDKRKDEIGLFSSNDTYLGKYSLSKKRQYSLIKDGLDNIYLATSDSIYQVYFLNNTIIMLDSFSLNDYNLIVEPCVLSTNNKLYFREYLNNNQLIRYFYIDKASKNETILVDIFDEVNYDYLQSYKRSNVYNLGIYYLGDIWYPELEKVRDINESKRYIDLILTKPIYSPLYKYMDSIYVFDMINNSLLVFDLNGQILRQMNIVFNRNRKVFSIEIDKISGNFYSLWKKNGIVNFDKINMSNGSIVESYRINTYSNPEKIQFRNDYIYFLYSNLDYNRNLFKMPVNQLNN